MWWCENFEKIFSQSFRKTLSPPAISRRALLVGAAALPLAACGFRPIYAPGGPGDLLRNQVAIDAPDNRLSFELVARLEERLGRVATARYQLGYAISTTREGIAITGSNDISRVRLTGTARYRLRETATDVQVLAGEVSSFTAYSTTGSTLASDTAGRDAQARLMVLLADLMADALLSGAARFP